MATATAKKAKIKFRPMDDRILLEPIEADDKTTGGIILPDNAREKPQRGVVLAMGPGKLLDSGKRGEMSVKLGDEVFMLLTLTDSKEKLPVAGRVVWITPRGSQGNKTAGIGVQFSELDKGATKNKIENQLAGALKSDRATHTI